MTTWKAMIVEDLAYEATYLTASLRDHCPEIEVLKVCTNIEDAIKTIPTLNPQLLFLDIELGNENGFDLLKHFPGYAFTVIFVTAHAGFVLDALRVSAADYLLKPYSSQELRDSVDRAVLKLEKGNIAALASKLDLLIHNLSEGSEQKKMLSLTNKDGQHRILISDILYCSTVKTDTSQGNISVRVEFRLTNGESIKVSNSSVSYYEKILLPYSFAHISQSFLINMNHIKVFNKKSGSVLMKGFIDEKGKLIEKNFEISTAKKEWFDKLYNQFVQNF